MNMNEQNEEMERDLVLCTYARESQEGESVLKLYLMNYGVGVFIQPLPHTKLRLCH